MDESPVSNVKPRQLKFMQRYETEDSVKSELFQDGTNKNRLENHNNLKLTSKQALLDGYNLSPNLSSECH